LPTASIDFTLATFTMIFIVTGAIFGINTVAEPYMEPKTRDRERYVQLGRYMILSQGKPTDWGSGGEPTALGFASGGGAYELDIDKVTRLNPSNEYAVNYSSLWQTLGVDDVSFWIEVDTLFDIVLNMISSQIQGNDTIYNFSAQTTCGGYPVQAQLSYHVAVRNSTYSARGSTDETGLGSIQFTLPNTQNGTALLVSIAELSGSIVSYDVLPFAHNSDTPEAAGTYSTLNPLNHVLDIDLHQGATAWNAAVFTVNYAFNLTSNGTNYTIPHLLDASPMIIVLTGANLSDCWAEWVAYPQVPLEIGADMSDDFTVSDIIAVTYIVGINGASYRFAFNFRSPAKYD
jgi:hypothetical protein